MWWTLLTLHDAAERCGRRSGSWQACGRCFSSVALSGAGETPGKTVRQRRNEICFPSVNDARRRAFNAAVFRQLKKDASFKQPLNCTHGDRAASRGISKFSATATVHACRRDLFFEPSISIFYGLQTSNAMLSTVKLGVPLEAWAASCRFPQLPLVSYRHSLPDERDVELVLGSRYCE